MYTAQYHARGAVMSIPVRASWRRNVSQSNAAYLDFWLGDKLLYYYGIETRKLYTSFSLPDDVSGEHERRFTPRVAMLAALSFPGVDDE